MARVRLEVERAMALIQEHLGESVLIAEIAKAVGLSEFHLHRVFHEAVGESVGQFITRKRMETAAMRLVSERRTSVTAIALEVGYSSTSNFSKAFRAFFGISPRELRSRELESGELKLPRLLSTVFERYGQRFVPATLFDETSWDEVLRKAEAKRLNELVRFEDSPALALTCLASPNGDELESLAATWEELIRFCRQLGICESAVDAWGMAQESPSLAAPEFRRYYACVNGRADVSVEEPLFRRTIAAGRFAVFNYDGPTDEVSAAYRSIYSCWFPESAVVPADYFPLEHYVGDWPEDGNIRMEIRFRLTAGPARP